MAAHVSVNNGYLTIEFSMLCPLFKRAACDCLITLHK